MKEEAVNRDRDCRRAARGSVTVEASLVVSFIILILFAVINMTLLMNSHSCALADVRRQVLEAYGEDILEGNPASSEKSEQITGEVKLGIFGSVSYREQVTAAYVNYPMMIRLSRILKEE